jgi:hypothetical protein
MIENFDEETAPNRRIESISSARIGPARWTAHTAWAGDFGDACFADPGPGICYRGVARETLEVYAAAFSEVRGRSSKHQ